jgi:hypothetical protein
MRPSSFCDAFNDDQQFGICCQYGITARVAARRIVRFVEKIKANYSRVFPAAIGDDHQVLHPLVFTER